MKRISSAATSSRLGSPSSSPSSSRSAHGLPCAARPTITAAAPVVARTAWARAREVMSPEATTGTSTSETSSAVSEWSAVPVYICRAERGWSVRLAAPASTSSRPDLEARAGAVLEPAPHLHRDRDETAPATASTIAQARAGIVEQRGARARLRHLAHRAAVVDVDDVRAGRLDHARGLGHRARLRAEDLDRERMLVGGDAQVAERPLVAVLDPRAAHHLRADEARRRTAAPGGGTPARSLPPSARARAASGSRPARSPTAP